VRSAPPYQDGDPEAIENLAKRINAAYEGLIDWVAKLRGASIPSEYGKAIGLLASMNDSPIAEYREFVDEVVEYCDRLPAQIAAGDEVEPRVFTFRPTLSDETVEAFTAELARIARA